MKSKWKELRLSSVDVAPAGRNLISSEWQRTQKTGATRHGERKEVKALIIYHCRGREERHSGFLY